MLVHMNASNHRPGLLPASDIVSRRLTVREPAELMAYIIHTLGFEPTRSWVGVAIRNRQLGAVMRGDLLPSMELALTQGIADPDEADRLEHEAQNLGQFVATKLKHDVEADRILLVYVLDAEPEAIDVPSSSSGVGSPPENLRQIDRCVRRGAALTELPVFESWVINERRVWHLYCRERGFCATQGSAVNEARGTYVSDSLTLLGQPIEADHVAACLPEPCGDPASLPAAPYEGDTVACWNWMRQWDDVLNDGRPLAPEEAALLVAPLAMSVWRDLLIVGACFGFETAVSGLAFSARVPEGLPRLYETTATEDNAWLVAETLTGRTGLSPDWSRLDRLRGYCVDLVPQASMPAAAATAATAAWIEWSRGRGTRATALLDQALSWDVTCSLASLLAEAVSAGLINPWALNKRIAWSGRDRTVA